MYDETRHFLVNQREASAWARLAKHLPLRWIDAAVQKAETTNICRRRLQDEKGICLIAALVRAQNAVRSLSKALLQPAQKNFYSYLAEKVGFAWIT